MISEFKDRLSPLLGHPLVVSKREPEAEGWPDALSGRPADLEALYSLCDGLELRNGMRILSKSEIAAATEWLIQEKSLDDWAGELYVIGEQADVVIVRDFDSEGVRAGGGVLLAPTDGLTHLKRVALNMIGFLEQTLLGALEPDAAPEKVLQEAVAGRGADAISAALSKSFYPGAERERAQASLTLGLLKLEQGFSEAAMEAFEQCARLRGLSARRGARELEMASAFHSCAKAAERAGFSHVAEACRKRAAYYSK